MSFLRTMAGMPDCAGAGDDVEPFAVPFKEGASPLGVPLCESDIWQKRGSEPCRHTGANKLEKYTHCERWQRWRGLGGRSGKEACCCPENPDELFGPLVWSVAAGLNSFFQLPFFCFHSFSLLSSLLSRFTPFLSGDQAINSLHLQFLLRTTLSMRNISRLDAVEFSTLSCYKVH